MITALIYVMLGLGLNIVVGWPDFWTWDTWLFTPSGAYAYALLNYHFGLGFWLTLPIAAGLGA